MQFFQITNGSLGEHAYLLGADDKKDCVIVDPGLPKPVLDVLEREGLNCVAILLTHGHFDHIGGVRQIKERYGAKVYIHELDAGMLTSNRLSLAVLTGDLVKPSEADVLLKGGETLTLAGLTIDVSIRRAHKGGVLIAQAGAKALVGDTLFFEAGKRLFPAETNASSTIHCGQTLTLEAILTYTADTKGIHALARTPEQSVRRNLPASLVNNMMQSEQTELIIETK